MTINTTNTDPPMPGSVPFIHNKDSAPAYWWIDTLWIVLADATDTGGRYSLMEELAPKGSGPGPHKHTWSDETYYMLDGEITFLVGDEIKTARKVTSSWSRAIPGTLFAWTVKPRVSSTATRPPALRRASWRGRCRTTERVLPPKNFPRRWRFSDEP